MRVSCVALLTASPAAASSAYRSILPALLRLPASTGLSRHPRRRHGYRPATASSLADNMLSGLRNAFGGPAGGTAATVTAQQGAAHPFLDNAPSWEDLAAMVEAQQRALNATPADLETVRLRAWGPN